MGIQSHTTRYFKPNFAKRGEVLFNAMAMNAVENKKLAVREGFEPSVAFWTTAL